jgi:hypothetical protein
MSIIIITSKIQPRIQLFLQISYAFSSAASVTVTNGSHNIIRMIPQGVHLASGLSHFVTFFNWTRVVIVTQNLPAFVEVDKMINI